MDELPRGVTADEGQGAVTLTLPREAYPKAALYGAAYVFIDRCFVLLDASGEHWVVTLTKKDPASEAPTLRELAGEFGNELLSCAWRHEITQANRATIEAVTMQAFGGAMGPPSLEELEAFDFTDDAFDDPLGIAQSWEEKYKRSADSPSVARPRRPEGPAEDKKKEPEGEP